MKSPGKGIAIIVLFLVGIPILADLVISLLVKEKNATNFTLSKFLASNYLLALPRYIWYVILALTTTYLIKQAKTDSKNKK